MIQKTVGQYIEMFNTARKIGTKIGSKRGIDTYKVQAKIARKFKDGTSYWDELDYFASFKKGKPFKIVDQNFFDHRGTRIYNAQNNTLTMNNRHDGYYSRVVKDAKTCKVKGQLDLYVGNDGCINFAAMHTPTGMSTGCIVRREDGFHDWRDDGFGYGPYENIIYFLRDFNAQIKKLIK